MDPQKDGQRTEGLARFIDNQNIRTNPFGHNRIGERAYRRAERLAAAIILLTNHVPENDPLRSAIRSHAVSLITLILSLRDEMRNPSSQKGSELKSQVRSLMSLLRLLAVSGYVSVQNADIVIDALDGLVDFLVASQKSALSESVSVSRDDLMDVRDFAQKDTRISEKTAKDGSDTIHSVRVDETSSTALRPKDGVSPRALSIMTVLKEGGEVGIREIVSNLPEYSEKMIQRELADLTKAGLVRKTGLKRWSRYSLAS